MAFERLTLKITGERPLMMHNARLANPLDSVTKELKALTSKKTKTEDDILEIKRVEWMGGIYTDEDGRPCLTEDMVLATIVEGAKQNKNGKKAKAALYGCDPTFVLDYDGPRDVSDLYNDGRFCDFRAVRVKQSKVMRSRPIFRQWGATVRIDVDTDILTMDEAMQAVEIAGMRVGLGDYRPRYGRFSVEVAA